jgi:hypothetical protein
VAEGLSYWEEWRVGGAPYFNYALASALQPGKIKKNLSQNSLDVLGTLLRIDLVTSVRAGSTGLLIYSHLKLLGWHTCLPGCRFRGFPAPATFLSKPSVSALK